MSAARTRGDFDYIVDLDNFNIGERNSFPYFEHLKTLSLQLPEPLD